MEKCYDEDLRRNVFFNLLHTEYSELLHRAIVEKWIICVPCAESLPGYILSESVILDHILIPSQELPETHFYTANKKQLNISNGSIRQYKDEYSLFEDIPILFTETFYSDANVKFDVLCLSRPIGSNSDLMLGALNSYSIHSLRGCVHLLLTESTDDKIDEIDLMITRFLSTNRLSMTSSSKHIISSRCVYDKCLKIMLSDIKIGQKCKNKSFLNCLKLSVESYILYHIYPTAMRTIITDMSEEISKFNKILRNVAEIQIQHLKIPEEVSEIIPKAREEISQIDRYSTVLGKCACLKRALNGINNSKNNSEQLLPILIFLIIKSRLPNWLAQLKFIQCYRFSCADNNFSDEFSFLSANLEAAVSFIFSDEFVDLFLSNLILPPLPPNPSTTGLFNISKIIIRTSNLSLRKVFHLIYSFDSDKALSFLTDNGSIIDEYSSSSSNNNKFCHPLCSCDNCEKLKIEINSKDKISIHTVNDSGFSVLHFASLCGNSWIVDGLLNKGVNPNVRDFLGSTPLNYAAAYGRQRILLLLMYANVSLDISDNDGNTALHLASNNGNVNCVKALLYFAEHSNVPININSSNNDGETALHMAVRWYFYEIVDILIFYGANPFLKNNRGLTSFDLTESRRIFNSLSANNDASNLPPKISPRLLLLDFNDDAENFVTKSLTLEDLKKVHKFMKAVKNDDLKTLKFYLGGLMDVVKENNFSDNQNNLFKKCHPLCQCDDCYDPFSVVDIRSNSIDTNTSILDINVCDSRGYTALHFAALYNKEQIAKYLLERGANCNLQTFKEFSTPLHIAAQQRHSMVAKIFINLLTCDVNIQDSTGNTALHYACITSNIQLIKILLKRQPKLDIKNHKGNTPLNEAENNLSFSIIELFEKHY